MDRGIITISENGTVTMPTAPVWMTQQEICDAFNVFGCYVRKAVQAIYKTRNCWKKKRCGTSGRTAGFAMTCTVLNGNSHSFQIAD